MARSNRGFLLTGLAIVAIAVLPIVISLAAAAIALALGCSLDEGSVHACPVLGIDLGPVLYAMGLGVWFVMVTFPLGTLALLVLIGTWISAALSGRLKRMDAPDANA